MMALRQQAAAMLDAMPEEVISLLIQQMQRYQQEQEARADKKMGDFLAVCQTAGEQNKTECLKEKYGSLTDALSGILPPVFDHEALKERNIREKYESAD